MGVGGEVEKNVRTSDSVFDAIGGSARQAILEKFDHQQMSAWRGLQTKRNS